MAAIVHLTADGDKGVLAVIAGAFGDGQARRCARFWAWQYVDNPFIPPDGPVIIEIQREDTLVGCVGTIACRVKVGNHSLDGMGVTHLAVLPTVTAKNLASLSVRICDAALAAAPAIFYGQANDAVARIWARSRCRRRSEMVICHCRVMCRPIRPAPWLARRFQLNQPVARILSGLWWACARVFEAAVKLSADRRTSVIEVAAFDDRFDGLWTRAALAHGYLMVRDRTFLAWRFGPASGADYTILMTERDGRLDGYCILRVVEDDGLSSGVIVDILADPANPAAYGLLVDAAIRRFRAAGAAWAAILGPPDAGRRRTLRNRLFGRTRRGFNVIGHDSTQSPAGRPIEDREDWYSTFADADFEPNRL